MSKSYRKFTFESGSSELFDCALFSRTGSVILQYKLIHVICIEAFSFRSVPHGIFTASFQKACLMKT